MKKILAIFLLAALALGLGAPAFAFDGSQTAAVTSTVGAAESFYSASVIARMSGRAGAATVTGAKGIAFECIEADIMNVIGRITNGLRVTFSESSIDALADLVVKDSSGNVKALLQCKDGVSDSYINEVIRAVKSGKYDGAELVGTKEFAERFNVKAAELGMTQRVKDSGVSTKLTTRIGEQALSIAPSASQVLSNTLGATAVSMAIALPISITESVIRGDDFFEATGNVITDLGISGLSAATAPAVSAGAILLLGAVGTNPATAAAVAGVVAILVPIGCGYALYKTSEKYGVEERIEEAARAAGDCVKETMIEFSAAVSSLELGETASLVCTSAIGCMTDTFASVAAWGKEALNSTGRFFSGVFSRSK